MTQVRHTGADEILTQYTATPGQPLILGYT